MASCDDLIEGCRHDRAPLARLGKICHERTGRCVYVLLCTECGFTVTTDELRRLRQSSADAERARTGRRVPLWGPPVCNKPIW